MQTFLPFADFEDSAKCLDEKRLGKQRVECKQILKALQNPLAGWGNHPATKMWRGHEYHLCAYALAICQEWIDRGNSDSLWSYFHDEMRKYMTYPLSDFPPWFGDEKLHASHRSNLLRKDRNYYDQFGWSEPDNLPYIWPVS